MLGHNNWFKRDGRWLSFWQLIRTKSSLITTSISETDNGSIMTMELSWLRICACVGWPPRACPAGSSGCNPGAQYRCPGQPECQQLILYWITSLSFSRISENAFSCPKQDTLAWIDRSRCSVVGRSWNLITTIWRQTYLFDVLNKVRSQRTIPISPEQQDGDLRRWSGTGSIHYYTRIGKLGLLLIKRRLSFICRSAAPVIGKHTPVHPLLYMSSLSETHKCLYILLILSCMIYIHTCTRRLMADQTEASGKHVRWRVSALSVVYFVSSLILVHRYFEMMRLYLPWEGTAWGGPHFKSPVVVYCCLGSTRLLEGLLVPLQIHIGDEFLVHNAMWTIPERQSGAQYWHKSDIMMTMRDHSSMTSWWHTLNAIWGSHQVSPCKTYKVVCKWFGPQ